MPKARRQSDSAVVLVVAVAVVVFALAVVALVFSAGGALGGGVATSSPPVSTVAAAQSAQRPVGDKAFVIRDAKGDVAIPGIDIVHASATRHPNGDLDVAMVLAGHYVKDGIYAANIESPGGGFYRLAADVHRGETAVTLFDVNAGELVEKFASGGITSNDVFMSALGSDLGWRNHGHYKLDFEAQSGESANPPTDKVPDKRFGTRMIVLY